MKALRIHAGPAARRHIEQHGLRPQDIGVIPGAAGGPKGLILGPLDCFLFGDWLARSSQPVHLVGGSIGAWRMATACLADPEAAFHRLEHDYIHQHYELLPGQKRPTADFVSERFGDSLQAFYGGRIQEVLNHPRYRLHIVTSRGRHVLAREHGLRTPLGYAGAFFTNAVRRKAMGAWLERVVFSSAGAALPFGTHDYRTRQIALTDANFMPALQASCAIPFVLRAVIEYIDNHLSQPLTLADLAAVASLSEYHFARMFRQSMKMAPHQYVMHQRMEKAKALVQFTQQPLTDIAMACGFQSTSHFSKVYRGHFGRSPLVQRAKIG